MRKAVAFAALALSAAMLTSCAGSKTETADTKTYTGSATGMDSVVTATLTMEEDKITNVEIDVSGETDGIGNKVGDEIAQQVLDAQSAEVDGVAGATVTSNAVKEAVQSALDQAAGKTSESGELKPGTYTATAHGAKHDITVEVDLSKDKIEDIRVTEANDSPFVSETAIAKMPARILENQSVGVDAVTGATFTSSAIRNAVSDCLTQAGANLADWSAKPEITQGENENVDVLVVGGGTSGLTAALAAKTDSTLSDVDSGLNIMVVEANGYAGGNMAICGGYIASYFGTSLNDYTGNSIQPDALVDSLLDLYPQYSDVLDGNLMYNIADLTDDTLNGLMARGFYLTGSDAYIGKSSRISKDGPTEYTSSTVIANKETGERSGDNGYDVYGGGAYFAQTMTDIVEKAGVDLRCETKATELIMDGDNCIGVKVQDHEKSYNIYAKKVILATGYAGFDAETIASYLPEEYGNVIGAETAANQSFAQKQVTALGGDVNDVHETISDGHIILGYNSVLAHFGEERKLYNEMNGMLVSTEGTRFTDDSDRGHDTAMKVMELGGKCYMIFDSTHDGVKYVDFLAQNGLAWTSDTIEGLAEQIGVPADALEQTIETYNSDYEAGADSTFGTPVEKMAPVKTAPYYAVQINAISTGGIDIAVYTDENMNVTLTKGGKPIGNLYACGGAGSGSYFPLCNIGLGSHVVGCMSSGVYAGNCVRESLAQ